MQDLHVVILAAGKGKRMVSELPKVLHPVLFRPMLHHVLDVAFSLPNARVCAVVGHGGDQVRGACQSYTELVFAEQKEQRGTADAVSAARPFFEKSSGTVMILSGDVILLRRETLVDVLENHLRNGASATVISAELDQPKGYGRILRRDGSSVLGIREEVDCTEEQRRVREVNAGVYCFEVSALNEALKAIGNKNRQNEFYLTDSIEYLAGQGRRVEAYVLKDAEEMVGINDRIALAQVDRILQRRTCERWMRDGVTIVSPDTVYIDTRSKLSPDLRIEPGCTILDSHIGTRTVIESNTRIVGCKIGTDTVVKQGSYLTDSKIGNHCAVGPYAHLRPGCTLADEVKIGNFVELKKTVLGRQSKASHLSYLGDAQVGERVNIGCGFITCNYDGGPVKLRTIIEDDVFVGSDSQAVAPVHIGRGAYIASGTTITLDVPADALALGRVKQSNRLGYGQRLRRKQKKTE